MGKNYLVSLWQLAESLPAMIAYCVAFFFGFAAYGYDKIRSWIGLLPELSFTERLLLSVSAILGSLLVVSIVKYLLAVTPRARVIRAGVTKDFPGIPELVFSMTLKNVSAIDLLDCCIKLEGIKDLSSQKVNYAGRPFIVPTDDPVRSPRFNLYAKQKKEVMLAFYNFGNMEGGEGIILTIDGLLQKAFPFGEYIVPISVYGTGGDPIKKRFFFSVSKDCFIVRKARLFER